MSFIQVQGIYVAVPVLMTLMSGAGTWLSRRFGRVQTMVLLKVFGVALLVLMAFLKDAVVRRPGEDSGSGDSGSGDSGSGDGTPEQQNVPMLTLLVCVYLLRTGLMNCVCRAHPCRLRDCVR